MDARVVDTDDDEEDDDALAIRRISLHRPTRVRFDVLPFAAGYAVSLAVYLCMPTREVMAMLAMPLVLCAHLLAFLVGHWSVRARCALQLSRAQRLEEATLVLVTLAGGRSQLCELEWRAPAGGAATEARFEHFQRVFTWTPAADGAGGAAKTAAASPTTVVEFRKRQMPTSEPIRHYCKSRGYADDGALRTARERYGANEFEIPARSFSELLVEHAPAPFFVFPVGPAPSAGRHSLPPT